MKKMMLVLVLMCISILSFSCLAEAAPPEEINSFANAEGLRNLKEMVSEDPIGFGFSGKEEVDHLQLGEGFRINYIDPDKLRLADKQTSIKSILKETNQWEFVVLSNGKPKSFLTVGYENNALKVTSGGGTSVDFGIAYKKLLSSTTNRSTVTLVHDKGIRILVAEQDKTEMIIPEISPKKSAYLRGIDNTELAASADLMSVLKDAQNAPDQDRDSGGLVTTHAPAKTTFPRGAIIISVVIALAAVAIVIVSSKRMRHTES